MLVPTFQQIVFQEQMELRNRIKLLETIQVHLPEQNLDRERIKSGTFLMNANVSSLIRPCD